MSSKTKKSKTQAPIRPAHNKNRQDALFFLLWAGGLFFIGGAFTSVGLYLGCAEIISVVFLYLLPASRYGSKPRGPEN